MTTAEDNRPVRTCKLRLKLTKDQEDKAWSLTRVARRYWNLLVEIDRRNGKGDFDAILSQNENATTYRSNYYERDVYKLTQKDYYHLAQIVVVENPDDYEWFYEKDTAFVKGATIREFIDVRIRNKGKVRFRKHLEVTPSFPVRCDSDKVRLSRIALDKNGRLSLPSIGRVRFGRVPNGFDLNGKKQTAQVHHDGKHWYLIFTERFTPIVSDSPYTEGVGIDLGLKTLAVVSNGEELPSIQTFKRYRRLKKRLKRLQRQVSRKYRINKCNKYSKTNNIKKMEREIKEVHRKLKHIRQNHILNFIAKLIKQKPQFITLEKLNVKGMLKNKHLAEKVQDASFYYIREKLTWKAKLAGIAVRLVDQFYPSSKLCSSCGHRKSELALRDRVYNCSQCGLVIDRDLNASYNLRDADVYELA